MADFNPHDAARSVLCPPVKHRCCETGSKPCGETWKNLGRAWMRLEGGRMGPEQCMGICVAMMLLKPGIG
eukprot:39158-Eustigmatos_ZCMA.PRE.1